MVTEVKKRRVMARDHDEIANYISSEKERRARTEWRLKKEEIWTEIDRQIEMQPPVSFDDSQEAPEPGTWHNLLQLGDLTVASETITADAMRLAIPNDRNFFVPHVELPFDIDEAGDPIPVPPERQRQANGVLRNLMVQQHKDFGFRNRVKLAVLEILHHGSVVCVVENQRMPKYHGGTRVDSLKAPVLVVHSMWNCFPDSSPSVMGTETFYKGTMIIVSWVKLQDALENPNWINKDRLQESHKNKDLNEHIEILTHYGDIFLKRHDGPVLFPNRKTVVSGDIFLESVINPTPYSPVIYTGYMRDDVRNPYYTSPIIKQAPMGQFSTHMLNRTMDSVDLKVKPPLAYDSNDNSLRGRGPEIYPGAKIGSRGGINVQVLDAGDPATGLAALQFAKQALQEGTTVDSVRSGVSPGTEQTATEVVKTEQRAEVREVEFVATLEAELLLPFLYMQNDLNIKELENYPFFNDEMHTPDFLRASKKDIPKSVIMEVTGSRSLLGEEQRTARFINTVGSVAQLEPLAAQTDWQEVNRQIWEDTRVKDPERFIRNSERNQEIEAALEQQQAQFQQVIEQLQQQAGQLQQQAQEAQQAQQKAEIAAAKASLQTERQKIQEEKRELDNRALQDEIDADNQFDQAEARLRSILEQIKEKEAKLACEQQPDNKAEVVSLIRQMVEEK